MCPRASDDGGGRGRRAAERGGAGETPPRIDYLTFAQGAVPVSIGGSGATLGANFEAAVIHGITFAFDSAEIRLESEAVLSALYDGLQRDASTRMVIEGHSSSEGATDYNQRLSERRARAMVTDLVRRGLPVRQVSGIGIGIGEASARRVPLPATATKAAAR